MATIEDELAQLAADRGPGDTAGGPPPAPAAAALVAADAVDDPDQIICVRAYPFADEPDSRNPWTEGRWQWRFRGGRDGDRTDSAARAAAFIADMHGLGPLRLPSGREVMSVFVLQQVPIPLGRDAAGRYEHTVNTRVEYVDATAHRPA